MADGNVSCTLQIPMVNAQIRCVISTLKLDKDSKLLANLIYDGKRLKWVHDFELLKMVIENLEVVWSGGGSRKFKCSNAELDM